MHASWVASTGCCLTTRDGEVVRVLYPGIPAGNFGPDYRDAVVAFSDRSRVLGDVELHLCGDDWRRHGHDTDKAYDHVILHVVASGRPASARCLAGGRDVPEVVLEWAEGANAVSLLPCRAMSELDEMNVRRHLVRSGIARMLSRAARIAGESAGQASWELLAHGVARALGYAANADASMELGRRLTGCRALCSLSAGDDAYREALAMGVAGLLPSQRLSGDMPAAGDAVQSETWWRALEPRVPSMDACRWRMNGLYPNNSPVRRVVALAGLWPFIPQAAADAPGMILNAGERPQLSVPALERLFRLPGDAYWRKHYDFGLPTRESDLVGGSKAREIVVNALLPWVAAGALTTGDWLLLSAVCRLLSAYPPASPHAVTRHMARQLNFIHGGASAAEQQGMLHLFREYCRRGLCDACPIGGRAWQPASALPADAVDSAVSGTAW